METRPLGDSGIEVSAISLGKWAMGATVETWGHVDDRESIAAIHQALDAGINLIDTAPIYGLGHSEEIVGKAISGRRDEVILATKCGLLFPKSSNELPQRCLKPESIQRECESSLRRLRTDYIDLYQCHWPDPDTPIRETMEALRLLIEQDKIRAIGLSNYGCEKIAAAREFGPIHSLQPPFSMVQPRTAEEILPFCHDHGIAVLPYSPLGKGLLTGKFDENSELTGIRARDPEFLGSRFKANLRVVDGLKEIAMNYDKTVAQLAINWAVHYPGVTSPIVGAKRPSQVIENVGGVGWTIEEPDMAKIGKLMEGDVDGC